MGIVQEIEIWPYYQNVYAQTRIRPENELLKIHLGFELQTDHLISARRPDLVIKKEKKKERTCRIVDFAVSANDERKSKKPKEWQVLGPCRRTKKAV